MPKTEAQVDFGWGEASHSEEGDAKHTYTMPATLSETIERLAATEDEHGEDTSLGLDATLAGRLAYVLRIGEQQARHPHTLQLATCPKSAPTELLRDLPLRMAATVPFLWIRGARLCDDRDDCADGRAIRVEISASSVALPSHQSRLRGRHFSGVVAPVGQGERGDK